jgi:hypothetical protein
MTNMSPLKSKVICNTTILWNDISIYDRNCRFNCNQSITVTINTCQPFASGKKRQFYDIRYVWTYDINEPEDHPFYFDALFDSDGEPQVWRNRNSDSLVKYLIMSNDELKKYSGDLRADCFRRDIIKAISEFDENGGKYLQIVDNCRIYPGDGLDPPGFGGVGWFTGR